MTEDSRVGMSQVPLIDVDNIRVERDNTLILDSCSWRVNAGENWVVFGPNGAGKTSLLNVIQGYLWPSSGVTRVFGGTLGNGVDVREMRKTMPVVSESVRRMIHDHLTGLEVLVTGARAHLNIFDVPTAEELEKARGVADVTGVTPLLDKAFSVMSTGERQRVLIARALMADPRVVILDEPCTGLDLAGREWVLHSIESIYKSASHASLLFTTHHVEEIAEGFTHALLIGGGRVFAAGPIETVFTSENLSELFQIPLTIGRKDGRWSARASVAD